MILQALYQLAQQEGLVGDPDYEWKGIPWLIRLDAGGRFLGIESTWQAPPQTEGRRSKPRPIAKSYRIPREQGRTSGDYAFFFFDKPDYVLGIDPAGKIPPEGLADRASMFLEKVRLCADATKDEAALAVVKFLEGVHSGRQKIALPDGCGLSDLFAFVFAADRGALVTERAKISGYWKSLRRKDADAGSTGPAVCLVTGQPCVPVTKHPLIKRVPGGTTSGVAVVSFNAGAFESYGWAGNLNASVSREGAENCATALNRLLSDRPRDGEGRDLPTRNIRLSSDTVVCYWAAGQSEAMDYIAGLLEANPEAVRQVYQSIWRGKKPHMDREDSSAFYALTLSGAQGRAVVRDWLESTVAETLDHLACHFSDLDIVRNTPKPRDHDLPPQIPLRALLRSLAPQGKEDAVPAFLAGQFIRAALRGTEYPFSLLQRALERTRAEMGKTEWADLERRDARAALIKAVLNRRRRFLDHKSGKEITTNMDPNNTSAGYLLGRLTAVIERMQQIAIGDVNASVVDRFFGGASATPRAVFPRLLRNLRHHARKALDGEKTGGTARWLEKQADAIVSNIAAFPGHLDLEQQGLFVLGYHHMRHWLWLGKEAREKQPTNQAQADA